MLILVGAFLAGLLTCAAIAYVFFQGRSSAAEASLQRERDDLERRLTDSDSLQTRNNDGLRDVSEKLARAEVQAARIPELERDLRATLEHLSGKREELASTSSQLNSSGENLSRLNGQFATLSSQHTELSTKNSDLAERNARLEQAIESAKQREVEITTLLAGAKGEMAKEFELLASRLFDEKGAKLNEQQRVSLAGLLNPFSETLKDFKGKVETAREADLTAREGLIAQIHYLTELNQDIGAKAQSLTNALRGESKTRGMWGEAVLQRILELAGLREGKEFRTQVSHQDEDTDGRRIPDVVLDLPQERAIVIDAKVSLVAYERYVSSAEEDARSSALKEHSASLQRHIRDLSSKKYPSLYNLKSVDFALLFVPIESALMAAIEADPGLAQYALERHIALVSPNTLFTVLRTIEYIWRVDKTTRNMDEIVKRGGLMYDAAQRFAEHIVSISDALAKATKATQDAQKALTDRSRGLVRQAERLKSLGVQQKKAMPAALSSEDDNGDSENFSLIAAPALENGTTEED